MSPRLVFLTGAPERKALDWTESGLLSKFEGRVARFVEWNKVQTIIPDTPASIPFPSWRSLPLERQHLPTGISQNHAWQTKFQGAEFFAPSYNESFLEEISQGQGGDTQGSRASIESAEEVLSQFYEESYAVHQDIPSSQIAAVSPTGTSFATDASSFDTADSFDSPYQPGRAKEIPIAGHLGNLKEMPNAKYLDSIHPQTMTVNLIVGIISNPSPRSIKTRRGAVVDLVELLVGDDLKSGFCVNFWLSQSGEKDTRAVLSGLRPQDVLLMRNVALSSFKGKVYGQSLRKGLTKVHLLYRNRIDKTDVGGCYSAADLAGDSHENHQIEKTRRVKEWVTRFVGIGAGPKKRKRGDMEAVKEQLPPDTQ